MYLFLDLESYDYIMKIVPTIYEDTSGAQVTAYQYTYAFRVSIFNIELANSSVASYKHR